MIKQYPFKGKLLVCDMDGTLLNKNNEVSSENKAAIERFVEGCGLFTLATGRTAGGARRYANELPVNLPAILMNGSQIYDFKNNEVLWRSLLEGGVEDVIKNLILHFPEMGIEIFSETGVHVVRNNSVTDWHRHKEEMLPGTTQFDKVPKPWYKIVLAWDNANLKKVEAFLDGKTGSLRTVFSEVVFLDLLNINTSKGFALETLMGKFDIQAPNVIAIGDNLNDLEMIQAAGIGVSVENAHEDLKKAAKFCSSHHDDHAVARVIRWIEENKTPKGTVW
jgi:Cof subfamily protein (haloacid dehalogenase superfamily)